MSEVPLYPCTDTATVERKGERESKRAREKERERERERKEHERERDSKCVPMESTEIPRS